MGCYCHYNWLPNLDVLFVDLFVVLRRKACASHLDGRYLPILVENVGTCEESE